MKIPALLILLIHGGDAFNFSPRRGNYNACNNRRMFMSTTTNANAPPTTQQSNELTNTMSKLKQVITKEYISFFNPMVDSWYAPDVTFDDPMTSLSGVDSYRDNVDMLAGRTLLGKVLFDGAGINLHSVTGGEVTVNENGTIEIADIITRWTLRMTVKILPWSPSPVFSGVSVYKLQPGGNEGIQIVGQTDYWDSINIKPNTSSLEPKTQYQKVDKGRAVSHFLDQLKPDGFLAPPAAPELPFLLLRSGDGYELRKYPGFVGIQTTYERRDYGFGQLGAFTNGMNPYSPSIMKVYNDDDAEIANDKTMMWPLRFTNPGEGRDAPESPTDANEKAGKGQWKSCSVTSESERVVAIRTFEDAAMAPVVRNADRELRAMLERDGLTPKKGTEDFVVFSQYDAVHSMGKRRGEVWIELDDGGHPF